MKNVNASVLALLLISGVGAMVVGLIGFYDEALGLAARTALGWIVAGMAGWTMLLGVRAVQTLFPALPPRAAWDWRRPIGYALVLYVVGAPFTMGLYFLDLLPLLFVVFYVAPIVVATALDAYAERGSRPRLGAGRVQA